MNTNIIGEEEFVEEMWGRMEVFTMSYNRPEAEKLLHKLYGEIENCGFRIVRGDD